MTIAINRTFFRTWGEHVMKKYRYWALVLVMLWANPAGAYLFTVGPGGSNPTIQNAIEGALSVPGPHEIRLLSDTFFENVIILPNGLGRAIEISGGWNASFTAIEGPPTIVDGGASGRVLEILLGTDDTLSISNIKVQNGAETRAAGIQADLWGNGLLQISDCEVTNNVASADRTSGGGLSVYMEDSSHFELLDSVVSNNQTNCSGLVDCREGGMGLSALGNSQVVVNGNQFLNNSLTIGSGSGLTGGVRLELYDTSSLELLDNEFVGNSVSASSTNGGIGLTIIASGPVTARRNRVEANIGSGFPSAQGIQMAVSQAGGQVGILSDSVIVKGNGKGLQAFLGGEGTPALHLVNLTVADNAETGVTFSNSAASGTATLSNSISVDNGENTNLAVTVSSTNNLTAGSADFVNSAAGNYRLMAGSDGINAGTNSPPGGLGPTDIDGNPRVLGGTVDIGAYEFQSDTLFFDGFESP